jgi:hypothetical protein
METGNVLNQNGAGRPAVDANKIDGIRESFQCSSENSCRLASTEVNISRSTVQKILHGCLKLHAQEIQILQELRPYDAPHPKEFAVDMLGRIDVDNSFLNKIILSDEIK